MNEKDMKKAIGAFLKNESWRNEYENAPSDLCRQYYGLCFYYSAEAMKGHEDIANEISGVKSSVEQKLGLEDLRYLYKKWGNNPQKARFRKRIEELEKNSKSPGAAVGA